MPEEQQKGLDAAAEEFKKAKDKKDDLSEYEDDLGIGDLDGEMAKDINEAALI